MKTKIELDVKLWAPPNFVLIGNPDSSADTKELAIPLQCVDAETLDRLCDDYRAAIFKKAGKSPPAQVVAGHVCVKCGGSVNG